MGKFTKKTQQKRDDESDEETQAHRRGQVIMVDQGGGEDLETDDESQESETEEPSMQGRKFLLQKFGSTTSKPSTSKSDQPESNRQRVLLLSSRGINQRQRHLLNDLFALMPHAKKESKFDSKNNLYALNEVAELNNCNNCVFFEVRRATDLYLWLAKTPNGPSVKFHVQNIHTMDELRLTGNCLKGSRPILSFDETFDSAPHSQLLKEMFTHIFGVPKTSRKIKPFIDHVLSFHIVDDRIWMRNYQISEKTAESIRETDMNLIEIGPRLVLNPIRIFAGSFAGTTLWDNARFVTPTEMRKQVRRAEGTKYQDRLMSQEQRKQTLEMAASIPDPADELKAVFS